MRKVIARAVTVIWCAGIVAGCATTDHNVTLTSQSEPAADAVKGSGPLFITLNGKPWIEPQQSRRSRFLPRISPPGSKTKRPYDTTQKITMVNVVNDKGIAFGSYVFPQYAGDVVLDVFQREFSKVGYTVTVVPRLPRNVPRGIDISQVVADIEEKRGLLSHEGTCELKITVDTWSNGTRVGSRDYTTKVRDFSVATRQDLVAELMVKASQDIVNLAVPAMITDISPVRR